MNSHAIKVMRAAANINQKELGEICDISTTTINKMESDTSLCSKSTINLVLYAIKERGITFEEKDGKGVITFPLDLVK